MQIKAVGQREAEVSSCARTLGTDSPKTDDRLTLLTVGVEHPNVRGPSSFETLPRDMLAGGD